MNVEHWDAKRDGALSEPALRRKLLEAGDVVRVPRGAEHSAEVVGAGPVVSLDAVKVS